MPEEHNNELPSIEDIVGQSELPSVEEFIEPKEVEEETQIIDDAEGNAKIEVTDVVQAPEWGELLRLINDVRQSIPEIPEIKTYDKKLEAICEIIDDLRESIPVVPEVRYYEEELETIRESVQAVKDSIPILPVWIEKVTEVPDFEWVAQTFTTIEDRFKTVKGWIENVVTQTETELSRLREERDTLVFESKTDFKTVHDRVSSLKDQIYDQLKEQSDVIWKLQKKLKENQKEFEIVITDQVDNKLDHFQDVTAETATRLQNSLNEKFESVGNRLDEEVETLKTKLSDLPKPKYYEEELNKIKKDLKNFESLKEIVEQIQVRQEKVEDLQENYLLNEPPEEAEDIGSGQDPLTPMDQKFATLKDLAEHYKIFINRIQTQLSTMGGGGETRLKYLDDIVGIATNPSVYDGKFLKYDHSSRKFEFSQPTAVPTGVAEDSIIYVAKDGDDSNAGTLTEPKLTIKSAVDSIVSAGTTDKVVRVAPGTYIENNPIILPDEVTVIGHSLRENTIIPLNDDKDLFYVGNGNYIAEMSFRGSMPGKAVVAFDPEKPRYINQSPYIQNCTNFIPDSIGLKIDGNAAIGPLKSMVLDSYTQYNQGGIGASITNQGYAQLVSMFTICNEEAIVCASGGACDLTNSNSSFGTKGLVADGVSGKKYAGIVTTAAAALSDKFEVDLSTSTLSVSTATYTASTGEITITTTTDHDFNVGMGVTISGLVMNCGGSNTDTFPSGKNGYVFNVTEVVSSTQFKTFVGVSTLNHYYESGGTVKTYIVRPYDGQVIFFNELYETVDKITITDGGSGYTSAPVVTISSPSESWGITAKAIATIENGAVTEIEMVSNGRGYETTPTVTIAAPSSGINTATGIAVLEPEYYTVKESTEISSGISTVTINENVPFAVGVGTTVKFFKQSRVLATGHSFEFIGSGTEIANSIPFNGGNPPIPENEVINTQGGLVIHTSTNQSGNFKIGDGVTINQNTSSITGQAYEKSLVSTITPYILSLGAL